MVGDCLPLSAAVLIRSDLADLFVADIFAGRDVAAVEGGCLRSLKQMTVLVSWSLQLHNLVV